MSYYHYGHQQPTPATAPSISHSHHGGRNRRQPRLSVSQNSHKQYRGVRSMKEQLNESSTMLAFRQRQEVMRSFDLEDDMEFCPNLLTESDIISIHSASASERSSLASNSPDSSPTQQPQQIAPTFSLNSSSPPFIPPAFHSQQSGVKLHQPSAMRGRGNAIPIVNPQTRTTMTSPPPSVSPAQMQPPFGRRW